MLLSRQVWGLCTVHMLGVVAIEHEYINSDKCKEVATAFNRYASLDGPEMTALTSFSDSKFPGYECFTCCVAHKDSIVRQMLIGLVIINTQSKAT